MPESSSKDMFPADAAERALAEGKRLLSDTPWTADAIPLLRQVCNLGRADEEIIDLLDKLYIRHGYWSEAAQWFQDLAESEPEWRVSIRFLRRSVVCCFRAEDWERGVVCRNRIIEKLPADATPSLWLDAFWPPGGCIAYARSGRSQEALTHLDAIGKSIDESEWTLYGRYLYHNCRATIFRETGEWQHVLREASEFLEWANRLANDDRRLIVQRPKIEPNGKDPSGELGKWECVCGSLSEWVVRSVYQVGGDLSAVWERLDSCLAGFDQCCNATGQEIADGEKAQWRDRLAGCYDKAGRAACHIGCYHRAVSYFQTESALNRGKLVAESDVIFAASLISIGKLDEARAALVATRRDQVSNGTAWKTYAQMPEFDAVRQQPAFTEIVRNWPRSSQ